MQILNWTNNEATKAGVSSFLSILRSSASFLAHAIPFELSSSFVLLSNDVWIFESLFENYVNKNLWICLVAIIEIFADLYWKNIFKKYINRNISFIFRILFSLLFEITICFFSRGISKFWLRKKKKRKAIYSILSTWLHRSLSFFFFFFFIHPLSIQFFRAERHECRFRRLFPFTLPSMVRV